MDHELKFSVDQHIVDQENSAHSNGVTQQWEQILYHMENLVGLIGLIGMDEIDAPDEEGLINEYIHDNDETDKEAAGDEDGERADIADGLREFFSHYSRPEYLKLMK